MGFLSGRGVDSVFRLHQVSPFNIRKGTKLGENDRLITWFRPRTKSNTWTRKEWNKLPSELKISFKGTVQQLNQWLEVLINKKHSLSKFRYIMAEFYKKLVDELLTEREGRSEPRTKKRRAKNYIVMNKPRKKMLVDCHRNRTTKNNAFYDLS